MSVDERAGRCVCFCAENLRDGVGHVVCMSVWVKGEVRDWVRLVIQCAAWERFCVEMCIEVLGNE